MGAGIRHVHLLVGDRDRSVSFYRKAFGMEVAFEADGIVFLSTVGAGDLLALRAASTDDERAQVGLSGGIGHFGIAVPTATDGTAETSVTEALDRVTTGGGRLLGRGEHAPGVPYAYVADPDGYVIEI